MPESESFIERSQPVSRAERIYYATAQPSRETTSNKTQSRVPSPVNAIIDREILAFTDLKNIDNSYDWIPEPSPSVRTINPKSPQSRLNIRYTSKQVSPARLNSPPVTKRKLTSTQHQMSVKKLISQLHKQVKQQKTREQAVQCNEKSLVAATKHRKTMSLGKDLILSRYLTSEYKRKFEDAKTVKPDRKQKISYIKNSDTPNDSLVETQTMFTLTTGSKGDEALSQAQ